MSVPKWRGEGTFRETKFSREGRESAAPGMEEAGACPPAAPVITFVGYSKAQISL